MGSDNILRVGLIGAGQISQFHVRALRRVRNARVIGVYDIDASRAASLVSRFGLPGSFQTLEEMTREGVDVVHVLTSPDSHAHLAVEALERGCDVLVEKPLAMNLEEVDRIQAAATSAGKRVCVNHSLLYDRFVAKALAIARSGALGTPLTFDYFRSSEYPPYRGGDLPIHYRNGGYPFLDQGVHALYLVEAFLGKVQDSQVFLGSRGRDTNLLFDEWRVAVQCEKGTGNIQISWNVRPLQNWFVLQGTKGILQANLFGMWVTLNRNLPLPKAASRPLQAMTAGLSICAQVPANIVRFACKKIVQYDGLQSLVIAFYGALQAGKPEPVSVEQARSTVYWTNYVSQIGDDAKTKVQLQFRSACHAKVLVTGASGLIGRHLVRRLLQQGKQIRILVRRQAPIEFRDNRNLEILFGDLGDPAAVDRAVAGTDIVYHIGAAMLGGADDHYSSTVVGTRNIVESVLRHGVGRLVYMSSLSCLQSAPRGRKGPVREDWPIEPFPDRRGYYTQAKTEAEQVVRDAVTNRGLRATLLRPARVFGPNASIVTPDVARRYRNSLVIIGDGTRNLPLVYVEDVVDALLLAAEKSKFDGSVFHIVDQHRITQNQLLREFTAQTGSSAKNIYVPAVMLYGVAFVIDLLARLLRRSAPLSIYRVKSALTPMEFDCSWAKEGLDWTPRIGVVSGLRETFAAVREEGPGDSGRTMRQ